MRIPKQPTYAEAKRIILGIIQESDGEFNGRQRLYKAFYYAHLYYWQKHGTYLTEHSIVHMPEGPGIDRGPDILGELQGEGLLTVTQRPCGPYHEDLYKLTQGAPLEFTPEEREAIQDALTWIGGKTGFSVSKQSHIDSPTWREDDEEGESGKSLHFYLDALSDEELEKKKSFSRQAKALLDANFTE